MHRIRERIQQFPDRVHNEIHACLCLWSFWSSSE